MAVYTQLEFDEIQTLVAPLALGRLVGAKGIAAGVENTTYFLDFAVDHDDKGFSQYVLTIAETLSKKDLEFIAGLMRDLSGHGQPVPMPVPAGDSAVLSIREKPALVVPRIAGTHPQSASEDLCRQVGAVLAELHVATLASGNEHESHRSLAWVETTGRTLLPHLKGAEQSLLHQELADLSEFVSTNKKLPQAIIHGDLFRDNVLVDNGRIAAVIDFFSAGTGYLLLDLAIVVNDWCFDLQGLLNTNNYNALADGYRGVRTPQKEEIECWSQLLRIAALRFWISRLAEQLIAGPHMPPGRGKNPTPFRELVLLHRDLSLQWPH